MTDRPAPRDRLTGVAGLLVALTLVALVFATPQVQDLLGFHIAAALAATLAFVKVRFVISDFMELRGTAQQRLFDIWLIIVGAGSVALFLR